MHDQTLCFTCGGELDLAAPHLALIRQLEREDRGAVTVLDAYPVEYRHEDCTEAHR